MKTNDEFGDDVAIIPYSVKDHYDLIRSWWALYYNGDALPESCLPDTGLVALRPNGKPAAVVFIYKTNSKMIHLHFAMADPEIGAGRRIKYVRAVIAGGIKKAKEFLGGQGFVWCCTDCAVIARVYQENGMSCPGEADVYYLPVGNESPEFLK